MTGRVGRRAIKAGFHLGAFFQKLAEQTGSDGGGHAGAAGFSAEAAIDAIEAQALDLARENLSSLEDPENDNG